MEELLNKDNTHIEKIKSIINSRIKKTNCFSFFNEICDWIEKNKADFYLVDNSIFVFFKGLIGKIPVQ